MVTVVVIKMMEGLTEKRFIKALPSDITVIFMEHTDNIIPLILSLQNVIGIIISGSKYNVCARDAPPVPLELLKLGIPILVLGFLTIGKDDNISCIINTI
jgi:hypothetical protein